MSKTIRFLTGAIASICLFPGHGNLFAQDPLVNSGSSVQTSAGGAAGASPSANSALTNQPRHAGTAASPVPGVIQVPNLVERPAGATPTQTPSPVPANATIVNSSNLVPNAGFAREHREFNTNSRRKVLPKPPVNEAQEFEEDDDSDIFGDIDYPELQVVPRASERLNMEAALERDSKSAFFWTLQAPAFSTLLTGLYTYQKYDSGTTEKDQKDHDMGSTVAIGVGATWLAIDYYLMYSEPYNEGYKKIKNSPKNDKKSELFRERMAEETIEKTARTMKILNTASIFTNVGAVLLTSYQTRPDIRNALILPLAISFIPYIFSPRYVDIYEKHIEYKRKIYAPLSMWNLNYDYNLGQLVPVYNLVWNF